MYIMCVILCLFNAFGRMLGALQISIIIFFKLKKLQSSVLADQTPAYLFIYSVSQSVIWLVIRV